MVFYFSAVDNVKTVLGLAGKDIILKCDNVDNRGEGNYMWKHGHSVVSTERTLVVSTSTASSKESYQLIRAQQGRRPTTICTIKLIIEGMHTISQVIM